MISPFNKTLGFPPLERIRTITLGKMAIVMDDGHGSISRPWAQCTIVDYVESHDETKNMLLPSIVPTRIDLACLPSAVKNCSGR
jgi:hypothetical protein